MAAQVAAAITRPALNPEHDKIGADKRCPLCHAPLDVKGSSAHCAQCERVFTLEARCPECHQPLEVLKACGAVDYFCQHGHGLISKKRVEFIPLV